MIAQLAQVARRADQTKPQSLHVVRGNKAYKVGGLLVCRVPDDITCGWAGGVTPHLSLWGGAPPQHQLIR